MAKFLVVLLLIAVGVGAAYHYYPKQTVEAGDTAKRSGGMMYRVTRSAVEAGMDQARKEQKQ
jgi:septal ring-binding cell division protein DamX